VSYEGATDTAYPLVEYARDNPVLTSIKYLIGANNEAEFQYSYDKNVNVTQLSVSYNPSQGQGGVSENTSTKYSYSDNQVTTVAPTAGGSALFTYSEDLSGNIKSTQSGGPTTSYNSMNGISSVSYDEDGNPGTIGTSTATYEARDLLASVVNGNIETESDFTYDARGRLVRVVQKVAGDVSLDHTYIWCGNVRCMKVDNTTITANGGTPTVDTIYFDRGALQAISGGGWVPLYYVRDALGSVRQLLFGTGSPRRAAVAEQVDYDPFGNPTTRSSSAYSSDIGYAGYFYEPATGLNFAEHRAYAPALERWITRDPIGNGHAFGDLKAFDSTDLNLYSYVSNNPASEIDPSGNAGFGVQVGGQAEGGLGVGVGGQGGIGLGYFFGGPTGASADAFGELGWFDGGPGAGLGYPGDSGGAVGISAGYGISGFITSADSVDDLAGAFQVASINVGLGPFKFSFQYAWSDDQWLMAFGPPLLGQTWGLSASIYDTYTKPGDHPPPPTPPAPCPNK
jgi:RHS repeat-associated protein